MAFAREARQVQQACQSGHPSRASGVEWQRQALAFCLGLALEGAHPSIGSRLERCGEASSALLRPVSRHLWCALWSIGA